MFQNVKLYRQFAIVLIVNLCALNAGWSLAWPSPVGLILTNEELSPIGAITTSQLSWVVSIHSLSSMIGALFAGYLAKTFGRKVAALFLVPFKFTGWLLAYFAQNIYYLYAARVLHGFSDAILFTVIPMYACEIASVEIRGSLGTVLNIFVSIGQLAMLTIGPFLSYGAVQLVGAVMSLFAILPVLIPESPYYSFISGKKEEALKTLIYLRKSKEEAYEELKFMQKDLDNNYNPKFLDMMRSKGARKGFILALLVGTYQPFAGWVVLMPYLQSIFDSTGTGISPEISSLITGIMQIFGCITSLVLTDKLGRKPLLCGSAVIITIGMTFLGLHYYFLDSDVPIEGVLKYLPIVAICLIAYCFNCGVGAIAFPLITELLSDELRSIGMSCVFFYMMLLSFGLTNLFPNVLEAVGGAVTYWSFALFNIILFLSILFIVPETKGRSIKEIQNMLESKMWHLKSIKD